VTDSAAAPEFHLALRAAPVFREFVDLLP
jgi:hypothetical protein